MDLELLEKAIENEKNENIMNLNILKIEKYKLKSLEKLSLPIDVIDNYMKKLKYYIYINSLDKINVGSYMRWIYLNDTNRTLNKGSIILEIKILDNGVFLVFKTCYNKYYTISFDKAVFFQKLNEQELILITAIDYITNH